MQLVLNNTTFDVASFTEVVALQEGDLGSRTVMTLVIRLTYTESLSELIPLFRNMDFSSFSINERQYEDFSFEHIEQVVEDFSNVTTMLHLTKKV
jgi:hypothetical protein